MQSYKFDDIIDRACERKELDRDLMKSISDFIFSETKREMKSFNKLRITLEGLMTFFYGKTRLELFKEKIENKDQKYKYKHSILAKKTPEEEKEIVEKVDLLLKEYEVFITDKRETKKAFKESKNELSREIPNLEV